MGRLPLGRARRWATRNRARFAARTHRGALEGDLALGLSRGRTALGAQVRDRRWMRRVVLWQRVLLHGQALDPLAGFLELPLAEQQVLASAGDRGDPPAQSELPSLERPQRGIELAKRLLVGER